jgi:endonuclease YncB( thermonuclease family)
VLSGDLVEVTGGHRVQIAGIVAPPRDTTCGTASMNALDRFLSDNGRDAWVWLEPRSDRPTDDGIVAAYLWVADGEDWSLVDEWLVLLGYAHAWVSDGPYAELINTAEWDAYQNARGCLWR